jgi:diacylglycerol kinase
MSEPPLPHQDRSWVRKFRDAFRGAAVGIRGQKSFVVHLLAAAAVIAGGFLLRVSLVEWLVLLLCITLVLGAEMFNSALESMAKAVSRDFHPDLGDALDIGSGAVLVAALGASIVGAILFVHRVGELLRWW